MSRVRVIRSSAVLALIQEAVNRALSDRGLDDASDEERERLAEASQEIFQGMMSEQLNAVREESKQLLDEYRGRLQETEGRIQELECELTERDTALQAAQSRSAELTAELQVVRKREESAAPESLLTELRALRTDLENRPAAPAPAAAADDQVGDLLQAKLDELGKELGGELARIGRKVGIANAEEAPEDLSSLFRNIEDVESNMDTLDAKESKGTNVDDALARMRRLKKGG